LGTGGRLGLIPAVSQEVFGMGSDSERGISARGNPGLGRFFVPCHSPPRSVELTSKTVTPVRAMAHSKAPGSGDGGYFLDGFVLTNSKDATADS
jgi:hypothetical protein